MSPADFWFSSARISSHSFHSSCQLEPSSLFLGILPLPLPGVLQGDDLWVDLEDGLCNLTCTAKQIVGLSMHAVHEVGSAAQNPFLGSIGPGSIVDVPGQESRGLGHKGSHDGQPVTQDCWPLGCADLGEGSKVAVAVEYRIALSCPCQEACSAQMIDSAEQLQAHSI